MIDPDEDVRVTDPRLHAAMAWVWNTSHWPAHLQRHVLGRELPVDFIAGILAAADDPLMAIVRDVLMDYGDACSGGHDDCLCSMNRLRMAYRARTGDRAVRSA